MHHHLIAVLKEDHAVLKDLVGKVLATRDFRKKQQLANDLYLSLNGHMAIVEKTVLPMLRAFTGHVLPDSVLAQFEQLRQLLSDLMAHRLDAGGMNAALAVLLPTLNLQNERERLFLLPAIERAIAADERAQYLMEAGERAGREARKGLVNMPAALMLSMA